MPKNNILIVGDLHGDWGKLNALIARHRPDIILQCGDFGWWPSFSIEKPVLYGQQNAWDVKGIKRGNTQIYWCDGNHEEHSTLPQDGSVHELYDGVHFCSRGSTLTLPDGRIVLFAGGADSIDKDQRTPGHDWYAEENIRQGDLERMLSHSHVDIVISHTCPVDFDIHKTPGKERDGNRVALQLVLEQYRPGAWFFGHWHKHAKGKAGCTHWYCLDYPRHGSTWWMRLQDGSANGLPT